MNKSVRNILAIERYSISIVSHANRCTEGAEIVESTGYSKIRHKPRGQDAAKPSCARSDSGKVQPCCYRNINSQSCISEPGVLLQIGPGDLHAL